MDFLHEMGLLALGSRFKRLGERLQADVAKVLKAEGIEFGRRWGPLFFLLNHQGPLPIGKAADLLGLSHAAVSLFSREMEKAGLVSSAADEKDERRRVLKVTRAGAALHRRMTPLLTDIHTAMRAIVEATGADPIGCLGAFEQALDERSGFERVRQASRTRTAKDIEIIDFDPRYRAAFKKLNLEWIDAYFGAEDLDRHVLSHPEREILDKGGAIVFARMDEEIVGTCALARIDDTTFELCKMAVTTAMQGHGVGERLARAILDRARARGARKVVLETHHRLAAAIGLYRKLGFVDAPPGARPHYARTDTLMELDLTAAVVR